ncbi:MAG: hypothetical protein ACLVEU_04840 [Bacteroides cellulosilyticus]
MHDIRRQAEAFRSEAAPTTRAEALIHGGTMAAFPVWHLYFQYSGQHCEYSELIPNSPRRDWKSLVTLCQVCRHETKADMSRLQS